MMADVLWADGVLEDIAGALESMEPPETQPPEASASAPLVAEGAGAAGGDGSEEESDDDSARPGGQSSLQPLFVVPPAGMADWSAVWRSWERRGLCCVCRTECCIANKERDGPMTCGVERTPWGQCNRHHFPKKIGYLPGMDPRDSLFVCDDCHEGCDLVGQGTIVNNMPVGMTGG